MNLQEVVEHLCEAIDARHTGCQVEVVADEIRVVRTFPYASGRDLLITDVLRAVTSPDWRRGLADAQTARQARIAKIENGLRLQEEGRGMRLSGSIPKSDPRAG